MAIAKPLRDASAAAGMCDVALARLDAAPSLAQLQARYPELYEWMLTFPAAELDVPFAALRRRDCALVPELMLEMRASKLAPDELDACAAAAPAQALISAADKVTPERLAWCREQVRERREAEPRARR